MHIFTESATNHYPPNNWGRTETILKGGGFVWRRGGIDFGVGWGGVGGH